LKGKVLGDVAFVSSESIDHVDAAIDDALHALGYTSHEVRAALRDVNLPTDESEALRTALQLLRRP
jgi:Holliday junction resolvasome RuvABC DNA-binding subunit